MVGSTVFSRSHKILIQLDNITLGTFISSWRSVNFSNFKNYSSVDPFPGYILFNLFKSFWFNYIFK